MAKATKKPVKKKDKIKKFRYYGVNITLQSEERSGPKTYRELVKKMFDDRLTFTIGHEVVMLLRTQFKTNLRYKGKNKPILYGSLLKFNAIKNWYNRKDQIYAEYEVPDNLVPNAFETDYIFIPDAHKFLIKYNTRVNIYQVKYFLEKALFDLIVPGERFNVNIMTSSDTIEKILQAPKLLSLSAELSYTNDEISEEAKELIDNLFKNANAGKVNVDLRPDATGELNAGSEFVNGIVGVAQNNGHMTATILGDNGRRKTINTDNYPAKLGVEVIKTPGNEQDEKEVIFNKIMKEHNQDGN